MRVVVLTREGQLPPRDWLIARFAAPLNAAERNALLLGRTPDLIDEGRTICACLGVREHAINKAVARGATSVEALGAATGAGTNCGSCRIELANILRPREEASHAA